MNWEDHFVWSGDYLEIMPLTAIGRVTIRELCLNRTGIRNVRRVLYVAGEHPPKRWCDVSRFGDTEAGRHLMVA